MSNSLKITLAALAMVAIWSFSQDAHAADGRVRVGISLGDRHHYDHVSYDRRWVPGYYVHRTETVLVEPAYSDRRWVPAVEETRYDRHGHAHSVCVREGYWTRVHVPARYETRTVREYVPGYWETVPVVHHHHDHHRRPLINIGGFFKF